MRVGHIIVAAVGQRWAGGGATVSRLVSRCRRCHWGRLAQESAARSMLRQAGEIRRAWFRDGSSRFVSGHSQPCAGLRLPRRLSRGYWQQRCRAQSRRLPRKRSMKLGHAAIDLGSRGLDKRLWIWPRRRRRAHSGVPGACHGACADSKTLAKRGKRFSISRQRRKKSGPGRSPHRRSRVVRDELEERRQGRPSEFSRVLRWLQVLL